MKSIMALSLLLVSSVSSATQQMAKWQFDQNNLPNVSYQGAYPFTPSVTNKQIKIEHRGERTDPYFLLGNYRMVLLTHVSGEYQLLTSERSWGRLNQGDRKNTGVSGASIKINGKNIALTGVDSRASDGDNFNMNSGVGYSDYTYQLPEQLSVKRSIKVAPSTEYDNGLSMMLIDVTLKNTSSSSQTVTYNEFVRANYEMNYQQRNKKLVDYTSQVKKLSDKLIKADFIVSSDVPFLWKNKQSNAQYEGFPPSLFVQAINSKAEVSSYKDSNKYDVLQASEQLTLAPGASKTLQFTVGFSFDASAKTLKAMSKQLLSLDAGNNFAKQWLKVLPSFSDEKDADLRRELIWDAHVIEAMSAYSQYFKETKTPQGSNYDYYWGQHASIRDHLQHMLPTLYYNPKLAKSALRYSLQKVTPNGGIPIVEKGYGYQTNLFYEQSDNQLFLLNSINEYLRVTKDYDFLNETLNYYPLEANSTATVIEHIEEMFVFLRDEVSVGPRGLVRLLNSDWNDDLYFVLAEIPYNKMYMSSESLLNTTMLVKVYGDLLQHINAADKVINKAVYPRTKALQDGIAQQRKTIFASLMKDWGDKDFIRRFYWGYSQSVGHDKAYIWPQAFALQIPEVSVKRKQRIIDSIDQRLFADEKIGARLMETALPTKQPHYAPVGMGENGAMWFSPYGQYVIGVAEVDIARAWQYFNKVTFKHMAKQYPNLWIGQWTAGDSVNSSLSEYPGNGRHMMYNAHPHAYQLYMYYRLKEIENNH